MVRDDVNNGFFFINFSTLTSVKNICSKIRSFGPDVIIVEKGVCQTALQNLHEVGIVVILSIKMKVLRRLARFLKVSILDSIGSMMTQPQLGHCHMFTSMSFEVSRNNFRRIVIIETTNVAVGCTVLLRGGSDEELATVKSIFQRLIVLRGNGRFEKAFLTNECFRIPDQPWHISWQNLGEHHTLSPLVEMKKKLHYDTTNSSCDLSRQDGQISPAFSIKESLATSSDEADGDGTDEEVINQELSVMEPPHQSLGGSSGTVPALLTATATSAGKIIPTHSRHW